MYFAGRLRILYDGWAETFRLNALGPIRVTEALLPRPIRGDRSLVLTVTSCMGGSSAPVSPENYVRGMLALVDRYSPKLFGAFFGFEGARMPWCPVRYTSHNPLVLERRST